MARCRASRIVGSQDKDGNEVVLERKSAVAYLLFRHPGGVKNLTTATERLEDGGSEVRGGSRKKQSLSIGFGAGLVRVGYRDDKRREAELCHQVRQKLFMRWADGE